MTAWEDFLRTRIALDPAALVDAATRERLDALPGMVRIRGDAAPLDYEIEDGTGVARVRLREGQAKRLQPDELPRARPAAPLRGAAGPAPPVLADTIPALQAAASAGAEAAWREETRYERGGGRREAADGAAAGIADAEDPTLGRGRRR